MTNITKFQDILGAANGDKTSVLGKFLYFSLANILVEKEALAQLCEDLNIPYSGSKRISVSDAFRSATGDIKDRITVKNPGALDPGFFQYPEGQQRPALVRRGIELYPFPGGQDFLRQSEIYVPVKLLGVNANLPTGQGAERPPRGVGNGKMPVTAGEIGLTARRYGNGRQIQPGFLPVKRRQQRPTRFVAGSSGEGAGRDSHSASMMSDSDGSLGRRFLSRSTRMATPTISTSRPHRLMTNREVAMGRAISTAPRTVVMTAGRMP